MRWVQCPERRQNVHDEGNVAKTADRHPNTDSDEGQAGLLVVKVVISTKDEWPSLECEIKDAEKESRPTSVVQSVCLWLRKFCSPEIQEHVHAIDEEQLERHITAPNDRLSKSYASAIQ